MSAPFFSVIIPVYNRAPVVADAIRSVLAQSCQDFEIVVVDDGSQDDSAGVIAAFGDPRIRFIAQDNAGGGAARNAAIDAARGRFIAPLDSDDVFLPHHLQTMKALLEHTRDTVGYARILVDRGQGRTFLKPPRAIRANENMAEYLLCERGFVPTITVVVARGMAAAIRYDENLRTAEDTDFAIRLSLSGQRFVMAQKPGAVWKDVFDPNRTSSGRRCRRFGDWLTALRPQMTPRAYHGGRGWAYAKLVARKNPAHALLLYLNAALRGCYAPRLAGVIFLQIFLSDKIYRALADHAIAWLRVGLRDAPCGGPRTGAKTDMMTRRDMLAGACSLAALPARAQTNTQTLKALAAARGLLFGSAFANYELKDADFVPVLQREAAILVPEYEMKRNLIEPQPGVYDFSAMDSLMAFAARNGMQMRGHTLCWYASNPPWLDQAVLNARDDRLLTDYVTTVAARYRGRMHSLDVVNEAIRQDGAGLRDSIWLKRFGPGYIDLAFHAARAADPRALLTYNDYGAEPGGPVNDRFRAATLNLLDGMIARGVPVQAYGMQGHLSAFGVHVDQRKLHAFLAQIEARGLAVLVTEMDVADEDGPYDIALRDRAVADETARFLDVVLDCKATKAVLTWSLSDRYLDPPDSTRLRLMGWRDRRVPYDSAMRKKPMWDAIARALAGRRPGF